MRVRPASVLLALGSAAAVAALALFGAQGRAILYGAAAAFALVIGLRRSRPSVTVQLEAQRSASLLQATLEATEDGILVVDREGRITSHNRRFLELWGLDKGYLDRNRPARIDAIAPLIRSPEPFRERVAALYADPEAEGFDVLELADGRVIERTTKPQRTGREVVGRVWSYHDVTEQRRAEEERRESQRRFRETLEQMSLVAIGLDLDGTITFCNDRMVQLSGWNREEMLGRRWHDLFVPADRAARARTDYFFDRMRAGEQLGNHENRMVLRSGEQRLIAWRDTPLRNPEGELEGAICIGEDVTERRRADEALREREERFRELIENSSDLIAIVDEHGSIRYTAPSSRRVLGYEPCELDATSAFDLIHPDDADEVGSALQSVFHAHGAEAHVSIRLRHANGSWRTLESTCKNLLELPGVEGIVINARDITELLASEERFQHAQKLEAVGRLAGGVAHDFNNLLTAIAGYTQFLLAGLADDDPLRLDAVEVDRAAVRATALTRQLLAFSRRQVLQPKVLDLNVLVSELEKLLVRLIGEHIFLETALETGLSPVRADPGQLEQVIVNLAVNGRDAMPAGGRLRIATSQLGDRVRLTVEDTGVGMDEATRSHLFEPFFTTKEQGKGTGLGLATVYGIIQQSGGEIAVESSPGQGTTFEILLPAVAEACGRSSAPVRRKGGLRGSETVLLVEDEPMVRHLARSALTRQGYTVLEVPGGDAALELAASHKGRIDLMVTDVVMPRMSGRELAERLSEVRPETRVLYTSGYDETAIRQHGLEGHELAFLPKPFTPDALARRVRELLDRAA